MDLSKLFKAEVSATVQTSITSHSIQVKVTSDSLVVHLQTGMRQRSSSSFQALTSTHSLFLSACAQSAAMHSWVRQSLHVSCSTATRSKRSVINHSKAVSTSNSSSSTHQVFEASILTHSKTVHHFTNAVLSHAQHQSKTYSFKTHSARRVFLSHVLSTKSAQSNVVQ